MRSAQLLFHLGLKSTVRECVVMHGWVSTAYVSSHLVKINIYLFAYEAVLFLVWSL